MRVILECLRRPIRAVASLLRRWLWSLGHTRIGHLVVRGHWRSRLGRYGFDLRGVGNCGLAHEENKAAYLKAREVFLTLCDREKIDLARSRVADIGCGTGFYAETVREMSTTDYVGLDITTALFPKLREKFPGYSFRQLDVTRERLPEGPYDLIIMIDVTQHITSAMGFSFAMSSIRNSLAPGGLLVVTSWLGKKVKRRSFYEIERTLDSYRAVFPADQFAIGAPFAFRDKHLFSVRRVSGRDGGPRTQGEGI